MNEDSNLHDYSCTGLCMYYCGGTISERAVNPSGRRGDHDRFLSM